MHATRMGPPFPHAHVMTGDAGRVGPPSTTCTTFISWPTSVPCGAWRPADGRVEKSNAHVPSLYGWFGTSSDTSIQTGQTAVQVELALRPWPGMGTIAITELAVVVKECYRCNCMVVE